MKTYTLRIYFQTQKGESVRTKKKKRFLRILRTINWQKGIKKAYLKVSYGKKVCNYGCYCDFYNEGYYKSKTELLKTFAYFDSES